MTGSIIIIAEHKFYSNCDSFKTREVLIVFCCFYRLTFNIHVNLITDQGDARTSEVSSLHVSRRTLFYQKVVCVRGHRHG